ncbi:MAG: 6,7-dimethyl-8-ribityllumazine synthase [Puniceicoccales bacterium]
MSFNPGDSGLNLEGKGLRIGIIAACYNRERVDKLIQLVLDELQALGVDEEHTRIERVPGAMEVPYAAARLAKQSVYHAVIGLGIVIAGDTNHHDVIGFTTANSLQQISIQSEVPIVNGILVTNTDQQADDRLGDKVDRGAEFARAAVALGNLKF